MIKKILCFLAILSAAAPLAAAAEKEAYLHFMNGMVQERKGNYDMALQEYRRTMLLDPGSIFVYKQALNLALHIGKVEEASQWAEFVVQRDSATAENWVLYGNVRWAKGDLEGARKAFERGAELDPASHEAVYQLASLWSSRDPEKSVGYLRKYLELKPDDSAEVYYQIAVLYNMKGNHNEVKASLLKSKAADPYYPQPRYMLANFYEARSDTAAALAEYAELMDLEPNNIEMLNHLGELYAGPAANNLPEAEKYFLRVWALEKKDPTACFWLSVIHEQRRDFKAAAGYLENSAALKDDSGLVLRLAYYYTQGGGYDRAIAMLEKAALKWPDNEEIRYFLALGYDDTRRTPKALETLRALVARSDIAAAETHFRYLLSKKPDNANVMNYLGYSLADRGLKLDEAELLILGAVSLEPANGAYLDSLAWVKYRRGKTAEALDGIKRALRAVPDDAVIWAHAGDIFAAGGDAQRAWLAWKNSWLLEKPDKRAAAAARLKDLGQKVGRALPALELAYLKSFSPSAHEFSSFAKLEGKLRGKTVKFDAIVHYAPPDGFTLTVMGPLMVPLWKARVANGVMDLDSISIKDIDSETFSYWAALIAGELKGWFAGDYLAATAWNSPCLSGPVREVCLDGDLAWPEEIKNKAEGKLTFRPGNYFLKNLYLFPETLEFKLPFVSLKLTLDREQLNFSGVNTLRLAD
jgi:tetratricopeptide (TPR) repeat protein